MQGAWDDSERAALVALLRTRPDGASWRNLTEDVAAQSSALTVWNNHHPAELFAAPQGPQDQLLAAERDIAAWRARAWGS